MASTIHIDIVSAEEEIFSGAAAMVYAPAVMGELGIAPQHTPLITRLKAGEVRVELKAGEDMQHFYVSGGLLEIQPHVITVLADTAIRAKDIDEAAAIAAKESAEKAIADQASEMDIAKAQAELADALAQLRALESLRKNLKR